MQLIKYDAACSAIAAAKSVDEAKEIVNKAEALRAYARQAKNFSMEIDAAEIRVRAERRMGEILKLLKLQGKFGSGNHNRAITLSDVGITSNESARAQNLATLAEPVFNESLARWRDETEASLKIKMPLAHLRNPYARDDHQRVSHLRNPQGLNPGDPLDKYSGPDGRKISSWRAGELKRLLSLYRRALRCIQVLQSEMPIANPGPFQTVAEIWSSGKLIELLESVWDDEKISTSDTPISKFDQQFASAVEPCKCRRCGKEFKPRRLSGKGRRGESKENSFCSRKCSGAFSMEKRLAGHGMGSVMS